MDAKIRMRDKRFASRARNARPGELVAMPKGMTLRRANELMRLCTGADYVLSANDRTVRLLEEPESLFDAERQVHFCKAAEGMASRPRATAQVVDLKEPVAVDGTLVKVFDSGAKRSSKILPFWLVPWRAIMTAWAIRGRKGAQKYYIHNWKKAIGSNDVEFVRQFVNHLTEHIADFLNGGNENGPHRPGNFNLTEFGPTDAEYDTQLDALAAVIWNAGSLMYYALRDPGLVSAAIYADCRDEKGE